MVGNVTLSNSSYNNCLYLNSHLKVNSQTVDILFFSPFLFPVYKEETPHKTDQPHNPGANSSPKPQITTLPIPRSRLRTQTVDDKRIIGDILAFRFRVVWPLTDTMYPYFSNYSPDDVWSLVLFWACVGFVVEFWFQCHSFVFICFISYVCK